MNHELIHNIEKNLQNIIISHYANKSINIFDKFIEHCQNYYEGPAHSLAEIRLKHNTKIKGDIFEHFALKYFQHAYNHKNTIKFTNLWLLKDVPEEILSHLKLTRNDLGIDLLAVDNALKYYAIQAKYRKKGYKATHGISWKQLSTFYGLINRTGPYVKAIVITNADYVRHIGKKTQQDQSICYGSLSKISIDNWVAMANFKSDILRDLSTNTTINSNTILSNAPGIKKIIIKRKNPIINIDNTTTDGISTIDIPSLISNSTSININSTVIVNPVEVQGVIADSVSGIEKTELEKNNLDFLRQKRLAYFNQI